MPQRPDQPDRPDARPGFWVRLQRRLFATGAPHSVSWFPELGFAETAADQADLWRSCYFRLLRRRWLIIILKLAVISTVLQLAAAGLAFLAWRQLPGWMPYAAWLLAVMIAGGGTGYALMVIIRSEARQEIRRTLHGRGVRLCLACGYDLRGADHARCPECGTPCEPPATLAGGSNSGKRHDERV